jgi:hypothetical protein
MPSDSEIRDRFREGTQPRGQIDVDAVLRRARARRRPRVILAGAGSVLAIAAIAVPATISSFAGSAGDSATFVAADEAAPESSGGGAADSGYTQAAPAEKLNFCAAPLAEVTPAANGLVISAEEVTAQASDRRIPVIVTLTNTGDEAIFGTTGSEPALTLSQDGVTLWHTNGPQDMMGRIVDLGPGESMTYQATFEPLVCGPDDDALESFPTDLPAAGPGRYDLWAAIDVIHDDGAMTDLVTGESAAVTLN